MSQKTKSTDIAKVQEALLKDFNELYVKDFTTDWKEQRFVRDLEIRIMGFDNLLALLTNQDIDSCLELPKLNYFQIEGFNKDHKQCWVSPIYDTKILPVELSEGVEDEL